MNDDITIDSATHTDEPTIVVAPAGGVPDPGDVESTDVVELAAIETPAPVAAAAPSTVAAAIDQLEPPVADETPSQRTERLTRVEAAADILEPPVAGETEAQRIERYARVSTEAKAFFSDSPANKRVMIALSKAKAAEQARAKAETDLKTAREELARKTPAAPPATIPPATAAEPVADAPFVFPDWNTYSEQHPEATHEEYIDARQDARLDHKATVAETRRQADETTRLRREWDDHQKALNDKRTRTVEAYKATDPDYDAAMKAAMDLPLPPAVTQALDDLDDDGPAVAKYLAQHREQYTEILKLKPSKQAAAVLAVHDTLKAPPAPPPAAVAPAPATPAIPARASAPSRPLSDAPSPGSQVHGSAQPTPSLAALAEAAEDADAYIVTRANQRKAMGLRR